MASKKRYGQLEFEFHPKPPRTIPKEYDLQLAIESRNRRNQRLGKLVLNNQNRGFFKRDRGLWIPASKGEISAVVNGPEVSIDKTKNMVFERTKHRGHARRAANATRMKIETYYDDAAEQRQNLSTALLLNPERSFNEYTVTHSELALEGIVRYVQDLNSFIERDWPQKKWRRFKSNTEKASKEVNSLYIDDLLNLYEEAFWSIRSRMRFWHLRGMNSHEPPLPPPIAFNTVQPSEIEYESEEYTNN